VSQAVSRRLASDRADSHWLTHMLINTKLRSLKFRESAYRIADTNGLCIEVRSAGLKAWPYRYRYAGKASIVTLADYPGMSTC